MSSSSLVTAREGAADPRGSFDNKQLFWGPRFWAVDFTQPVGCDKTSGEDGAGVDATAEASIRGDAAPDCLKVLIATAKQRKRKGEVK